MRLIDLHVDWLLQYAGETTVFDPSAYARVPQRLDQVRGYLQDTSAAVLACYRHADDWARHRRDPWAALGELIVRLEAEFPGRLLLGPDDCARWRQDADGLCWGVIGVEGFDALVRSAADLDRLPGLFDRGVRVFQPLYTPDNALGGSSTAGDDRRSTAAARSSRPCPTSRARAPGRWSTWHT
jgi:membrane dipeptidase